MTLQTITRRNRYLSCGAAFLQLVVVFLGVAGVAEAQTNTFPATGNVGIGTTIPNAPLQVSGQIVGSAFNGYNLTDNFIDSSHLISHYGLTWADFSNGAIGPSAVLSGYGGINLYTVGARRVTISPPGNVGIGTASPIRLLDLESSSGASEMAIGVQNGAANYRTWNFVVDGGADNRQRFYLRQLNDAGNGGNIPLFIDGNGNVGLGTTNPTHRLDVLGELYVSSGVRYPDGTIQKTAFDSALCGGDYAESVNVQGTRKGYEPGDLLVINTGSDSDVQLSQEPYSRLVAGIYSTKPGITGRRQGGDKAEAKNEIPMAMVGIVPSKATTENGPIKKGDLLVSAATPGHVMKGTDPSRMLGAIVGKAMGNLDSGSGVIEVLVSLQ